MSNLKVNHRSVRKRLGPKSCYGTRERLPNGELGKYLWKSYDEVHEIVTSFAKTCEDLELCPIVEEEGIKTRPLGIFCKTREEWMFAWMATWYISGCIVPLYDTLGEESIKWIIHQAELTTVVTTTPYVKKLATLKSEGQLEELKNVVLIEEPTAEESELLEKSGLRVLKFWECVKEGKESKVELKLDATPDTLATICYTSGTTSAPKGVMLTHKNYIATAVGVDCLKCIDFKETEICISWLPLAHVFEQFTVITCLTVGTKIGFYSGEVMGLVNDMKELKPNYFGSVPRVFNKIYDQTNKEVAKLSGFKKWMYEKAVNAKIENLLATGTVKHSFYDKFVFSKIRNTLGGNIILIFLGGAPIDPELQNLSKIWLSSLILQGYGQTETTGPIVAQRGDDVFPCSIGSTFINAEAKLQDIPEMHYYSTDTTDGKTTPRGEILLRGPAVSPGYWRNPELTKETFTEDGWIHTGDVGKLSPWGHLIIIDRKKHIFKLAQVIIKQYYRANILHLKA